MANALILLWLAAFPLMGSPGPATLSLAGIGTAFGFRRGVPYLLGIVAGTTVVLMMIATGVTALILADPRRILAVRLHFGVEFCPLGRVHCAMTSHPCMICGCASPRRRHR